MQDILVVRLSGRFMSFGDVTSNGTRGTTEFPAPSMLTGLFGNIMGWDYSDYDKLERLQKEMEYVARIDRPGELWEDYQVTDLSQPGLLAKKIGWTSSGFMSTRAGENATGNSISLKYYWAGRIVTVAMVPPDGLMDELVSALLQPRRPPCLGRKACTPDAQMFRGVFSAKDPMEVIREFPRYKDPGVPRSGSMTAWYRVKKSHSGRRSARPMYGLRNWRSDVHMGRQFFDTCQVFPPIEE